LVSDNPGIMQLRLIKILQITLAISALIFLLYHLQVGQFRLRTVIYPAVWLVGGIALLIFIIRRKTWLGVILVVPYIFVTPYMALFYMLCAWDPFRTEYVNKQHPRVKLVDWTLDCGAFDSHPDHVLFKETTLLFNIKWSSVFEPAKVDTTVWRRAKDGE
jgi:hypothetical protein